MVKRKYISRIGLLMAVSQLLLFIFVFQWLAAQYRNEKDALEKDLNRQFVFTWQQVMDSMIVETIINPALQGEKGFKVHIEVKDDSTHEKSTIRKIDSTTFISKEGIHDVTIVDSGFRNFNKKITYAHRTGDEKDILLDGVRLFFKEVSSRKGDSNMIDQHLILNADTILFKKLLVENLDEEERLFRFDWNSGKQNDSIAKNKSSIYLESKLHPMSFGVEVSKYNGYLLKKLTPQFLFAFALLILTGIAFYIAYRSLRQQMRLSVLKDDFISNISHELKTPVSTVKVAIEALKNFDVAPDPKMVNDYLEMASLEMDRLELLISKVLNTSLLENGKQFMQFEKTNLRMLVEEVLASLKLRFLFLQAKVNFVIQGEEFYINADKLHIQGVIINLLDNSLKYGIEKPEIEITLKKTGDQVALCISDNGPGIPEEFKEKIFEKFFRIPTGDRHNVKGYGLGLNYASLVMEQHKGSIQVTNNEKSGCMFTLTFPSS